MSSCNDRQSQALPQGWCWLRLNEICAQDRRIVEPDDELDAVLPYLSLEHVESNTGRIMLTHEMVPESEASIQSATLMFDARHVLYGKLRPYLNKVALPDFQGRCTTELVPLLPNPGISRRYLAWIMRRPETVQFAMRGKTGSRMPRANMDELLTMRVPIPASRDHQEHLAGEIERRMTCLERARSACLEQLDLIGRLERRWRADYPLGFSSS